MYELPGDVASSYFKLCAKMNKTKQAFERVVSFKTRPRINIPVCFSSSIRKWLETNPNVGDELIIQIHTHFAMSERNKKCACNCCWIG